MGALIYQPEAKHLSNLTHNSLDKIAEFQEHDDDKYVANLLSLSGSSASARPKALMHFED